MKKTVIIAIILAYIASILIVQFFGLKVIGVEGNVYITDIEIHGFEFVNRKNVTDSKYLLVKKLTDTSGKDEIHYAAYFIPGTYDKTPESLASNPNRIKVLYLIRPYNATNTEVGFIYDQVSNENILYFDSETQEIVFLSPRTVSFVITSNDGSMIRKAFKITFV